MSSDLETNIVAVERIGEYISVPSEVFIMNIIMNIIIIITNLGASYMIALCQQ